MGFHNLFSPPIHFFPSLSLPLLLSLVLRASPLLFCMQLHLQSRLAFSRYKVEEYRSRDLMTVPCKCSGGCASYDHLNNSRYRILIIAQLFRGVRNSQTRKLRSTVKRDQHARSHPNYAPAHPLSFITQFVSDL